MKICIIHSGSSFSTSDCVTGLQAGLELNGCEVRVFPLHINLQVYCQFVDWAIDEEITNEAIDPFKLAARGIGDWAIQNEPDAVIAVSGANLHPMAPLTLRNLAAQRRKPFPVALWCTESPYQIGLDVANATAYDAVFVNERKALHHFKNERKFYLQHAYNPKVHCADGPRAEQTPDVFFVGTGFEERRKLFNAVDWQELDFLRLGFGWDGFDKEDTVNPRLVTANEDAAALYRSAKINLNHHRTTQYTEGGHINQDDALSIGPRAYEIAACGGFQLCDDARLEYKEVFGDAAATYKAGDAKDLERQIHYWLDHPDQRAAYANAQYEAVQPHSWQRRAANVLDMLLGD